MNSNNDTWQDANIYYEGTQNTESEKHSEYYSELLNIYIKSLKKNMNVKIILKILFFLIIMGILIGTIYIFNKSLNYMFNYLNEFEDISGVTIESILALLTIIVPSISSLIVGFLKLPAIIAQYLFNAKEDDNMNSIIKNIQDYDKEMFALEQKAKDLLTTQNIDFELQDEEIDVFEAD